MKIVTTPMCEEIVKLSGFKDYSINKHPTNKDGDLAIVLSESKVEMNSISIKLNTPLQIFKSFKKISNLTDDEILRFFDGYELSRKYLKKHDNSHIKVKVYSKFLKDIVDDFGFEIGDNDFDYVIFPDYLKNDIEEKNKLVEIPSHSSVSKNPFERVELRYSILEKLI